MSLSGESEWTEGGWVRITVDSLYMPPDGFVVYHAEQEADSFGRLWIAPRPPEGWALEINGRRWRHVATR